MQLPGDPGPFLDHRPPGLLRMFGLQAIGVGLQLRHPQQPLPEQQPHDPEDAHGHPEAVVGPAPLTEP